MTISMSTYFDQFTLLLGSTNLYPPYLVLVSKWMNMFMLKARGVNIKRGKKKKIKESYYSIKLNDGNKAYKPPKFPGCLF